MIVLGLGFLTLRDLLSTESTGRQVAGISASRQPSSIGPVKVSPAPTAWTEALVQWNLDCGAQTLNAKDAVVKSGFLRLKGRHCGGEFKPERLRITNESNGSTAVIFPKNGREFETDLIQLQDGANRIRIQYGTQSEQILTVTSAI